MTGLSVHSLSFTPTHQPSRPQREASKVPGQQVTGLPSSLGCSVPVLQEPSAQFLSLLAFMMSQAGWWILTVPYPSKNIHNQTAFSCLLLYSGPQDSWNEGQGLWQFCHDLTGPCSFLELAFYLSSTKERCTQTAIGTVPLTVPLTVKQYHDQGNSYRRV